VSNVNASDHPRWDASDAARARREHIDAPGRTKNRNLSAAQTNNATQAWRDLFFRSVGDKPLSGNRVSHSNEATCLHSGASK
jgi:hypothetical protein